MVVKLSMDVCWPYIFFPVFCVGWLSTSVLRGLISSLFLLDFNTNTSVLISSPQKFHIFHFYIIMHIIFIPTFFVFYPCFARYALCSHSCYRLFFWYQCLHYFCIYTDILIVSVTIVNKKLRDCMYVRTSAYIFMNPTYNYFNENCHMVGYREPV